MSIKLESDVYGWCHLVKATEVTASLVESNGSLLPGGWLKVTCRLTSVHRDQLRAQCLVMSMRKLYLFYMLVQSFCVVILLDFVAF